MKILLPLLLCLFLPLSCLLVGHVRCHLVGPFQRSEVSEVSIFQQEGLIKWQAANLLTFSSVFNNLTVVDDSIKFFLSF